MRQADLARLGAVGRRPSARPGWRSGAGSRNGGRVTRRPPRIRPAMECTMRPPAPRRGQGGNRPGRRAASIDLPEPGGPTNSRLWPPAAAISSARLAFSWPFTSRRSATPAPRPCRPASAPQHLGSAEMVHQRDSERGGQTSTAPAQAASRRWLAGQISPRPSAARRPPREARRPPGSSAPSSEFTHRRPAVQLFGRDDTHAAITARAIGRS